MRRGRQLEKDLIADLQNPRERSVRGAVIEPEAGGHVTRIEDYTNGTVMVSSVVDGQFIQLHGTWVQGALTAFS
jgi:hypothetical protein